MINTRMFTSRLQKILSFYELSASAFAEKMGVGRSSISHIISGRNKPSLDFVLHILENFKEVSFEWLMFGKGDFPKNEIMASSPSLFSNSKDSQVIDNQKNVTVNDEKVNLFSNETSNNTVLKNKEEKPTNKTIERIIVFYTDGTFNEYKN